MSIDFRWSVDRGALKKALDKFKKTFDARSNIPVLACVEVTPDLFHGGELALYGRFRIALNFPDLKMTGANSFMKIMESPEAIRKAMVVAAGGKE